MLMLYILPSGKCLCNVVFSILHIIFYYIKRYCIMTEQNKNFYKEERLAYDIGPRKDVINP